MSNKARNTSGKFAAKSDVPRKVRSVNLTENCWQWLARIAEEAGMSRNDYLEALADGNPPLMETVEATANPIMETVQTKPEFDESIYAALVDAETAKKSAAIFGFSSDEALADAHFQINMLASNYDELEDRHEALKREYSLALPLMETVQTAPTSEVDTLIILKNQEIAELKAQLAGKNQIISEADEQISKLEDEAAEYAETKKLYNEALSEEIRGRNSSEAHDLRQQQEISNLKSEIEDWKAKYLKASNAVRELNHGKFHQPTPIAVEFPESAIILSQLRAKRKKSKADLGDIEFVVEMLEVLKN